jgi:hypothetical protein
MFSAAGLLQAGRPKVKRKPTPTSEDEMWIFPGESRIHTHYKYIYLSNLSIHPSIHPPIHPSIHPIYLSIYLSSYLSIYLSIDLSIDLSISISVTLGPSQQNQCSQLHNIRIFRKEPPETHPSLRWARALKLQLPKQKPT